jgi:hypothetical protein
MRFPGESSTNREATMSNRLHSRAQLTCETLEDRCLMSAGITPKPPVTDWFSSHLKDPNLVSLVRTLDANHVLSRSGMLAIFAQVEKSATVSSTDFADLQTLVANASYLGTPDYVNNLANKVVNGSSANQYYQGTALGNLKAGSTSGQLVKLVNKWFEGSDHPIPRDGNGTLYVYQNAAGTLFGSAGPVYQDVHQGYLGDCYFLASLGETAKVSPSIIKSMFIDNGDNTWTVRFYRNGVADYVTVDRALPTYGSGYFVFANMGGRASWSTNVLWVALAEKAYVELNEAGGLNHTATNNYAAIAGGWIAVALGNITGRATYLGFSLDFNNIVSAFNSGRMIGFASNSNPVLSSVVGNHAYALVGYDAKTQTFTLFNPWGINNGSNKPGLITLTFSQLVANFSYWDSTRT